MTKRVEHLIMIAFISRIFSANICLTDHTTNISISSFLFILQSLVVAKTRKKEAARQGL